MEWTPLPVGVENFEEIITKGYSDILKYGIAFYRKECMVKQP